MLRPAGLSGGAGAEPALWWDLPADGHVVGHNTEDAAVRVKCSLELEAGSQMSL